MNFFLLWLTTFLGVFIFTDVTIGIYLRMLNVNKIKHIITYNVQDTLIRTLFSIRKCTTCREKFEYTKGVIRICISKNEIQYNGQMKKDKRTNNDLQNITWLKLPVVQPLWFNFRPLPVSRIAWHTCIIPQNICTCLCFINIYSKTVYMPLDWSK